MAIGGIGSTNPLIQNLIDSRTHLDDLQRQLGTGRKSETFQGLGSDAGADVAFRQQISVLQGFQQTITRVEIRLNIIDTALGQVDNLMRETRASIDPNLFTVVGDNKTVAQKGAEVALGEALSALNTRADGRYVFSGRTVEQRPLAGVGQILDGDGVLAGFRQVVDERNQADLGASGLGRMTIGTVTDTVTLAEDGAHLFGFKIDAVQNNLSFATVTSTAGPPRSEAIQFTGSPQPGETLTVELVLPDGTQDSVTLTVSDAAGGAGTFQAGATPAATAANFDAALNAALAAKAATALDAASAVQAGRDFFNTANGQPPQRVDGPPFDSAIAMRDGSADTVAYYLGDNTAGGARQSSSARIDTSLVVDYGARGNEQPLSTAIQSLAVFAVKDFSQVAAGDAERYSELSTRIRKNMAYADGTTSIKNMHVEIVSIARSVNSAQNRHVAAEGILTQTIEDIEGISMEEVSAKILTLQTRLQASYQTTALLNRLSLVNFL